MTNGFSSSDRSVHFTKSADERHADFVARVNESRRRLLNTLKELNRDNVHPLNPNYWTEDKGDDALVSWAHSLGLLSQRDHAILRGW